MKINLLKSQNIRILDVFVIGPLMIAAGWALRKKKPLLAYSVAGFGVTTIGYNARNYRRYQLIK